MNCFFLLLEKVMSFDVLTQPSHGHVCSLEKQMVAHSGFSFFVM